MRAARIVCDRTQTHTHTHGLLLFRASGLGRGGIRNIYGVCLPSSLLAVTEIYHPIAVMATPASDVCLMEALCDRHSLFSKNMQA